MKSWLLCFSLIWSGVFATEKNPTWAADIAPLIYRNCGECHRPEQVAPFSLLTYQDAAKRARFITKPAKAHYMPP